MNKLMQTVTENVAYVVIFLAVIVGCFLVAVVLEKSAQKKNGVSEPIFNTRKLAMIGMFSAIAMILHVLDFPIFFAPGFYKMDFSELPILVGSFAFGPVAGVMMEFVKILLKLCIKGTSTAFIGDLANFVVGCSLVLPASIVYYIRKNKKMAIGGLALGTLIMTIFGSGFNALYLLPKFSELFGMPMDAIIGMGTAINSSIHSVWTLVFFAVVPFNILKGVVVSAITMLLYKHISPILKKN